MANVLNKDKQIAVIAALAEGSSIRAIERITGISRNEVEVFDIPDAPQADRVYAWAHDTDIADEPRRHGDGLTYPARYIARESR